MGKGGGGRAQVFNIEQPEQWEEWHAPGALLVLWGDFFVFFFPSLPDLGMCEI